VTKVKLIKTLVLQQPLFLLGEFLLSQLDVELLFDLKQVLFRNVHLLSSHYYLVDILLIETLILADFVSEVGRHVHHVVQGKHFLSHEIV
jgi:hypothetical protein